MFGLAGVVVGGFALLIWALNRPDWEPTPITSVAAESASPDVSVIVEHLQCGRSPRVDLYETPDVVRLRAEQDRGGNCDDVAVMSDIEVRLDAILGGRAIEVEEPRGSGHSNAVRCVVDGAPDQRCLVIVTS